LKPSYVGSNFNMRRSTNAAANAAAAINDNDSGVVAQVAVESKFGKQLIMF